MWFFIIGFIVATILCVSHIFVIYKSYIITITILIIAITTFYKILYIRDLFMGMLAAYLITISYICFYKNSLIPTHHMHKDVKLSGYIASIPITTASICRIKFTTKTVSNNNMTRNIALSLFSKAPCPFKVGQLWHLTARLKPLGGNYSLAAADSELQSLINNIHARGFIKLQPAPILLADKKYIYPWLRLQQYLWQYYEGICTDCSYNSVVAALLFGISWQLKPDIRQLLAATGTSHLLAISGLHVGMLAALVSYLGGFFWSRRVKNIMLLPSPYFANILAIAAALFYCAISGFGLPAARSVVMLVVYSCSKNLKINLSLIQVLAITAFLFILYWPFVIWSKSFLLSFGAVFLLAISLSGKLTNNKSYTSYIKPQIVISLGLSPLIILFWQQVPLYSVLVNMLAIPIFSLLVVPLAFLVLLCFPVTTVASFFAHLLDKLIALLFVFFTYISSLPYSVVTIINNDMLVYCSLLLATALFLLPTGFPGRYLSFIALLPLFCINTTLLEQGFFRVVFLDVGQGSAALVQTRKHNILFDTGPAYPGGYSAGETIVWPYLKAKNINKLDDVIVSHPDLDHRGGLAKIIEHVTIKHGYTSATGVFRKSIERRCIAGYKWHYDGVMFEFLWPQEHSIFKKNNNSCVLKITSANNNTALLTGDIEKKAEKKILEYNHADKLNSRLLFAPHHGSKGSSSKDFITAVAPQFVVFSSGKYNKFMFPHELVLYRYACVMGNNCFNIADTGTVIANETKLGWQLLSWRAMYPRLWH